GVCDPVMTYDLLNGPPEPHLSFPTIPGSKLQITGKNQWRLPLRLFQHVCDKS
ncbi:putative protein C1orf112 like, partial [Dissostichus eleginoides]